MQRFCEHTIRPTSSQLWPRGSPFGVVVLKKRRKLLITTEKQLCSFHHKTTAVKNINIINNNTNIKCRLINQGKKFLQPKIMSSKPLLWSC